ncbi:MAG TPA: hypothetical protein VEH76_04505 [Methylocystis sp.]|nr:hypothetical protein [Methylocystis sp.]
MTKHMAKATRLIGRYSPLSGVSGGELPRAGARAGGKIEIVHGHEVDPEAPPESSAQSGAASAPAGRKRRRVAINARTDLLEYEHQHGRLSPQAYAVGRYVDAILEAANGRRGGVEFGERNRVAISAYSLQQALAARMDAAREAARLKEAMAREIGRECARVVSLVIGDGLLFRDIARMEAMTCGKAKEGAPLGAKGRDCERAARRIAGLFRHGLEELAAVWEKKGRPA